MSIKCIIDDNQDKWGRYVQGIKVVGGRDKIVEYCALYQIDEIIIAIPSAPRRVIKEIIDMNNEFKLQRATPIARSGYDGSLTNGGNAIQ